MVGKFLFGMFSGGVLVTGGLVVASALFPLQVLDSANSPLTEPEPVTAPVAVEPAEPEVKPTVETEAAEQPQPEPVAAPPSEPAAEDAQPAPEPTPMAEAPAPIPTAVDDLPPQQEAPPINISSPAPPLGVPLPDQPATPAPLAKLDEDAVLAALEGSALENPPPAPKAETAEVQPAETPEPAPEPAQEVSPEPTPEPAAEPAPAAEAEPAPEPTPPVAEVQPAPEPEAEPEPQPEPNPEPEATEPLPEPEVAAMPENEEGPTFKAAPSLADKTEGVIVGRLPRIGDAEVEAGEVPETEAETDPADARPIVEFAAAFENPDAKPVLAIVLIDPGTADLNREALAALPFPVSMALDPLDPATPDRAAIYRAGGKEVVMLATGFPAGAQASDIEVAFQSMAQGLPEAVAVMDLSEATFQNNRPLASLIVPVVGAQGRGLLTWDQGLNAADQVARREDVASAVVFRDLVSTGDDSASIRRILDRAVFKAGQDGRVALAGTASEATVAALLEWAVEGRAATIAIAPLTAVMQID